MCIDHKIAGFPTRSLLLSEFPVAIHGHILLDLVNHRRQICNTIHVPCFALGNTAAVWFRKMVDQLTSLSQCFSSHNISFSQCPSDVSALGLNWGIYGIHLNVSIYYVRGKYFKGSFPPTIFARSRTEADTNDKSEEIQECEDGDYDFHLIIGVSCYDHQRCYPQSNENTSELIMGEVKSD